MVSHCPSTSKAITERSDENGCDSKYRYHCMRTKQGSLTEHCLEISWIQDGNCAIYNTDAKRVDAEPCNENLGICPQKQYLSNDVTSYSACVNDPEVHVSSLGPTSYIADLSTPSKSPSDGSRYDRTHMPSILVVVSALIAVIAIIVIIVICMNRRRIQSSRKKSCPAINSGDEEIGLSDHEEEIPLNERTDNSGKHEITIEETRYAINSGDEEIGLSDHEEEIPLNERTDNSGKHEITIEETRYDIEPFYKTRTYEYVERQVGESAVSILIIGNPGSGKSVLAEMLHNNFCGKKVNGSLYDSRQFKRLEDVDSYPSRDGVKMIYIIDDCFEDWNQYPHLVTTALEKFNKVHEEIVKGKGNSLVITITKWNFDKNLNAIQKARLKQCDKLQLVDLSEEKFKLDITDKSGILEFHRKKRESTTQRLDNDDLRKVIDPGLIQKIISYVSEPNLEFEFPLSCRLFYSHESFVAHKEDFFNETKRKVGEYVRALSKGSSEEKSQYCTLIYMALSGGKVQDQKRPNLPFLETIASARSIELDEKTFNFGCCLVKKGNDDVYEIVHEEITTLLFASFGFVHAAFVIDSCDIEVLLKFMRTDDRKLRDDYYALGLLVLTYNMYDRFAKRLQNLDDAKRMHIIFKDKQFETKFRIIVKNRIQKRNE